VINTSPVEVNESKSVAKSPAQKEPPIKTAIKEIKSPMVKEEKPKKKKGTPIKPEVKPKVEEIAKPVNKAPLSKGDEEAEWKVVD
jgi:hypothetical protein